MKTFLTKHYKVVLFLLSIVVTTLLGILTGIVLVYQKGFPQIERLEEIQPKITTIIYDDKMNPFKEFAVERRTIIRRQDIPKILENAIIASEDNQFYSHWGINFKGSFRAVLGILTGRNMGGGSSITQQLALNLFLKRERTLTRKFTRKIQEIFMAIQIEKKYSKDQILTFYCNKIFLGYKVYGMAEAAKFYFGKPLKDINLAEAALIPTIMPSPNGKYNVFTNPQNCLKKRNYILKRMMEFKYITEKQYEEAIKISLPQKPHALKGEEIGNYYVEEIRKVLESKFGENQLYTGGLRVYSTIDSEIQKWAEDSIKEGIRNLDKRIGWRSKPGLFNLKANHMDIETETLSSWKNIDLSIGNIMEGVVTKVTDQLVEVRIHQYRGKLLEADAKWTRKKLTAILKPGDVALFKLLDIPKSLQDYIELKNKTLHSADIPSFNYHDEKNMLKLALEQEPEVQGAILVVDNKTGEIKALIGGYSFDKSKWNNATQALRQTGSTFKPIVYTAALENGYSPSSLVEDKYYSYFDKWINTLWEPNNYGGKKDYLGWLTLRRALEKSRNVCTAQIAEHLTPYKIVDYAHRFGITSDLRPYMSISLGAFEVKLSEMVAAYTVFANLGIRVKPFMIKKIVDQNDNVLEENLPDRKQVIDRETAFVMNYLLQGVVQSGTAWKARALNAPIGGKTGTTNDFTNAWFIGFCPSVTVGVWVGYEEPRKLGYEETGAKAALPIFISFMEKYLHQFPQAKYYPKPSGVVWVNVDKYTGKLAAPDCLHVIREAFITGSEPLEYCSEEYHKMIDDYYGDDTDQDDNDG